MNNQPIYFLKNLETQLMVIRLFIFIFLVNINISHSNIIYDKNEITISSIELNKYIDLYKSNYGNNISKNKALKNIVLIKKTIDSLFKNNHEFMEALDKKIKTEFNEGIFNDQMMLNFIRFQKIRNEFISEYFKNSFDIEDLEIIFSNFNNLQIPISKNKCLTIDKFYNAENDKYLIKNFFEVFKNNQKNYKTLINNEVFDVCINEEMFKKIEYAIIQYIENKTERNFNNFIYGKTN